MKKRIMRNKSITNNSNKKLYQFERSNSNSNISSISKKTGAFEENFLGGTVKMNSFSTKLSPNNLCFSIQNNLNIHSSVDLSIKDIKEKTVYTNINISIDNPNFSINNIENNNNKNTNIIKIQLLPITSNRLLMKIITILLYLLKEVK